jgi:hypothetical protein
MVNQEEVRGGSVTRVAIKEHDGYEVDESGAVFHHGKSVKVNSLETGYRVVNMRNDKGRWHATTVARLVLEAFVGPKPVGHEARHMNGDPSDCSAKNLRWERRGENRAGESRQPNEHGRELRERRLKKRVLKEKLSAVEQMRRELEKMQRELGMEDETT